MQLGQINNVNSPVKDASATLGGNLDTSSGISFVESDPIFSASPSYGITLLDIDDWNAAYNALHTHANKAALDLILGTNTGDETNATIKTKLGAASSVSDGYLASTDWSTFNGKVTENSAITGATKTKITYDSKGLVTSGSDATTSDIAEGTNLYYLDSRVSSNTDVAANTAARHNAVSIGTANGLSLSTQSLSLQLASSILTGALSSTDWITFNSKQIALGFTPENVANKSTSISVDGASDTKYPSAKAVKTYADGLVAGLLDYRGAYDASVNTWPSSGGSGTAGAVLKGDMWVVSVAGVLGGTAIQIGDSIIANTDTPNQTSANWNTLNSNISYVPEDSANKVTTISSGSTNTQYPSAKLVYDQLALKQNSLTLTTTGSSGAATLIGATLNIPQYSGNPGTVTSVAALTLGTTGTDLSSTVANSTTTPVITLNVPTASASNRGVLSTTDWSAFNGKQAALSGTGFVKSTAGTISYDTNIYLTANQSISLSGAVTGSGTTSIATTLANSVVGISNLSATGTPSSSTYLRGDNTWAIANGGITSVGLSMPSAFTVTNSPLIANGTIAVTGAGTTSQYIAGNGSLITFPTVPTNTSQLINDGDNGVSHFISLADLPSNISLYPTNAASGINSYYRLVTSLTDPLYNTTAVNIPTGTIVASNQFIAGLISYPNIIVGNPGIFNITTIGNIQKTSGTGNAEFYFEVWKRTNGGTETLITTSGNTLPVVNSGYTEFSASALWNDGSFLATDMIVLKFYGNHISGGSNPSFQFQFGGTNPVRTSVPVPLTVIPVTYTPSALTKTDDTNVTLTLGGTPSTALLQATSLTLGWSGTLADSRIASSSNWNTAYTNRITSLTTTGSSGSATLSSNTLNVPTYTLAGLGGQTALTNPITGTGVSGQVAFFNGTTTEIGDNGLFWDNTNKRLGIGTTAPGYSLTVAQSGSTAGQTMFVQDTTPGIGMTTLVLKGGAASSVGPTDGVLKVQNNSGTVTARLRSDGVIAGTYIGTNDDATVYLNQNVAYGLGVALKNTALVNWSSTSNWYGAVDTAFSRLSAAKIAIGNGTAGDYTGTLIAGNIGIGTTSPTNLLHIYKNSVGNANLNIQNDDTGVSTAGFNIIAAGGGQLNFLQTNSNAAWNTARYGQNAGIFEDTGAGGFQFTAFNDTSTANIRFSTGTTPTERMRITNNGNVGIGTTGPGEKLEVAGNIKASGSDVRVKINADTATTPGFEFYINNARKWLIYNGIVDQFVWKTNTDNRMSLLQNGDMGLGGTITDTAALTGASLVIKSGNVGIGTTSPTGVLDVTGANATGILSINDSTTPAAGVGGSISFGAHTSSSTLFNQIGKIKAGRESGASDYSSYLAFSVNSNSTGFFEAARINSAGNFGIRTSNPTQALDVRGLIMSATTDFDNFSIGSMLRSIRGASTGNTYNGWQSYISGLSAIGSLVLNPLGGNVGIGLTSPTANLQVAQGTTGAGTVATNGTITLTGTFTQFTNTFKVGDTITVSGETVRTIATIASDTSLTVTVAFSTTASGLAYTLVGGNVLSVLGNGNVGIGTTNPASKLDVTGGILVNGTASIVPFVALNALGAGTNNQYFDFRVSGVPKFQFGYTQAGGNRFFIYNSVITTDAIKIYESNNNIGIGTNPTASLHIKAGTATASTAPIKLTSGTLLTTPEAGAIEFLTDAYYATITTGAARKQISYNDGSNWTFASQAIGDLLYASSTTAYTRLAAVAAGSVLRSNGVGAAPVWGTPAYASEIVTTPTTGTLTLKAATETYGGSITNANVFTIALPAAVTGVVNESIYVFKIGATLPTITQPTGIVWRGTTPTLVINSSWTISYEQVNTTGSTFEIWATAVKNV